MPREIRSVADAIAMAPATPSNNDPNTYKDRLVKLIPSEIVTAYITLQGLISGQDEKDKVLYTAIAFISLLILTPFYLSKIGGVNKIGQIIFTTLAFIIWVMASGGFHNMFPESYIFQKDFLGSLLLIIYTLAIPFVYKG